MTSNDDAVKREIRAALEGLVVGSCPMKKLKPNVRMAPRACAPNDLVHVLGGKEPGRQGPMPPIPKDPPPKDPPPCPK